LRHTSLPLIIAALLLTVGAALAQTQTKPAAAPAHRSVEAITPEEARRALETLEDDARRKQIIETLRTIAKTAPEQGKAGSEPAGQTDKTAPSDQPSADEAAPKAQEAPAGEEAAKPEATPTLNADGLGAQLLLKISSLMADASREIAWAARSITHFPALWYWVVQTTTDPAAYRQLLDIAWKFAVVFGFAFAVERLVWWALQRPLRALDARTPRVAGARIQTEAISDPPSSAADIGAEPELRRRRLRLSRWWQSLLRVPFVLARLMVELLPIVAFLTVGALLLGTHIGELTTPRLVILAILNAYALCRTLIVSVRTLIGPLGIITTREETAAYIDVWTRRIVTVGITGFTFANVALLLGLHPIGYAALLRLASLAVHLLIVVVILQIRAQVARLIRSPRGAQGLLPTVRNRIAALWHYLAIALVMALWLIWALNIRDGYALLLQYVAGTIAVLIAARLASILILSLIDRGFRINADVLQRFPGLETRANRYLPLLRRIASAVIAVIAAIALLQVWGVDTMLWFYGGQIGGRLLSAVLTVGVAAAVAVGLWEASNALMDRQLATLTRTGQVAGAARLRTFQPILRTVLLCVMLAIVALTALSEIGVNVAPLLAGAGIVGIAIGFGSQKLVQDLITGLFLLLENVVQVGDLVTVSGLTGTVEDVSIRTIRLRAGDGAVHIVPFSAVTSVTNASRGVGNASVNVSVAFKEDIDRVSALLQDIVVGMRQDPQYQFLIRGDLELWGVDKVDGSTVTLVGQIRCTNSGRWPVQREFNRRLKQRFQEEGIEIASNSQMLVLQSPLAVELNPASRPQAAARE